MDPHSPHKLFATKYCFLILGDDTSFFFFISFFFGFLLFYVISFYKNYFIIIYLFLLFFFHENYFYFFMFRNVPECSVMYRNVPCSGFSLSTPISSKLSAIDIIQYMFVPQLEYFIKLVTGDDFSLLILIIKKDLRLNINRIDFSL